MGSFSFFHWLIVGLFVWLFFGIFFKKSKPRSTPKRQVIKTDTTPTQPDAIEGDFWEVEHPKPSDVHVHLIYKDGNGLRTVNIKAFATNGEGSFSAQCLMRNAHRTFLFDRVEQAIDPSTGEIINNLHQWLLTRYNNTPQGKASNIALDNLDLLKVLLYVAKADGRMTAAEIAVISTAASEITGVEMDIEATKFALNMLSTPSISGFKQAFGRLANKKPDIATKAMKAVQGLVNTEKTIHPSEQEALDYIYKKMIAT
jgi:hypothetical protein